MTAKLSPLALVCLALLPTALPAPHAHAENWPRLRGPDATGLPADPADPRLPARWSATEGIAWKVDVPGLGWSSPVVWGQRVFLTSVTNDAADDNEQPRAGLYNGFGRRGIPSGTHQWMVHCFDLDTGRDLWKREAHRGRPPVGRHPKSTYAAETPVTDGERLYVLFGDLGMWCYDLDGKPLWQHTIEPKKTMYDYGAAASPVLAGELVVYVYDNHEASYIAALDRRSGELMWRKPRDEKSTWASPFVWQAAGRTEIVVPGKNQIRSYAPDGEIVWSMDAKMSNLVIPSPFAAGGLLYIASGYFADRDRPAYAIKPGARGDITLPDGARSSDHVAWYDPKAGPYNTTPLVYDGTYYLLLDRGMLSAYDAKTGDLLYDRERFPRGASFTSSPWAYNGEVFCLAEDATTYVIKAGGEFEIVRTNTLGDDEMALACPAIVDGRVLLRTSRRLYCITGNPGGQ